MTEGMARWFNHGVEGKVPPEDIRSAVDLGLVRLIETGGLDVSNPIY